MSISLIAADCGKSTTKICLLKDGTLLKDSFPTAYGLASDGRSDLVKAHTFSIEGAGKKYRIGSGALPIKADDSYSKDSEITKVCNLAGGNIVLASMLYGNSPECVSRNYYTGLDLVTARQLLESS